MLTESFLEVEATHKQPPDLQLDASEKITTDFWTRVNKFKPRQVRNQDESKIKPSRKKSANSSQVTSRLKRLVSVVPNVSLTLATLCL